MTLPIGMKQNINYKNFIYKFFILLFEEILYLNLLEIFCAPITVQDSFLLKILFLRSIKRV